MAAADRLALLKIDLGIMQPNSDQVNYLSTLLDMAASDITRKGVVLDDATADDALVTMLAGWYYRVRGGTAAGAGMPVHIRNAIHDRLAAQKMRAAE